MDFVDRCAVSISIEPCRLSVSVYSLRTIRTIIRDKFCTLKHLEKIDQGKCAVCRQWLRSDSPKKLPCCGKKIHEGCWTEKERCTLCRKSLWRLPCCVCKKVIEAWGTAFEDVMFSEVTRTNCCGADVHRTQQESGWFPLISKFCIQIIYRLGNYGYTSTSVSKRVGNIELGVYKGEGFPEDILTVNVRCANKQISMP